MENRAISDVQITASSEWGAELAAIWGRLYMKGTAEHEGAWEPAITDTNQWLQIDLGVQKTNVTRVATQGRDSHYHRVTTYSLQYSDDGVNFQDYIQQGESIKTVNVIDFTIKDKRIREMNENVAQRGFEPG